MVIKDYKDDAKLRLSFNELAKKTFGINFEDWYQNGYWTDRYNPHSIVVDGKVVANVSVNRTDFAWNGEVKHFFQLGTVMTDEQYRNRGFIRRIMEEIDRECAEKADGIYLFANNSVLDFYPKFGFKPAKQYEYVKVVSNLTEHTMTQVSMNNKNAWDKLERLIQTGYHQSAFELIDNSQLNMFYVTKYMQNDVYYSDELDAYVVAELDGGTLAVDSVISNTRQDINRIVEAFGKEVKEAVLGFTPQVAAGFSIREMNQDDCQLFVKGNGFAQFDFAQLMFPVLAHA